MQRFSHSWRRQEDKYLSIICNKKRRSSIRSLKQLRKHPNPRVITVEYNTFAGRMQLGHNVIIVHHCRVKIQNYVHKTWHSACCQSLQPTSTTNVVNS